MLKPIGPTAFRVSQEDVIELSVRTVPNGVVTFTTFHAGQFANGLPSQSVAADASGKATVSYTAGEGVVNDVQILSGSPRPAVRFVIWSSSIIPISLLMRPILSPRH